MTFEEMFKNWTLDQKVEWALGPNICNLSENMRSIIVDLNAENERLKRELKQTEVQDQVVFDNLRKENAKLKCTVLHAMCRWLDSWSICVGINIMKHRKFGLFKQIKRHLNYYRKAYRNAKAELREGK